jgi:hypothetical protein
MKKVSDVFKSIRFAKNEPRGKSHSSTDNEEHYTVGEKEYNQQLKHVKKMAMQESGGDVVYKKGDHHIEKYGEDSFALYKDGKKQKFYTSIDAAKTAMNESLETLDEKNVPTSPEKWAQAKSQAKAKFDVYPSAYANGWAAKKYKEMGGGWKSVSEAVKDKFDIGEYDQEGDMAKSDLRSIMANAKKLHDMIEDADNLPEWCQNKITLAEDYISTVANYLTAEMSEETEIQEDEKKPDDKFKSLAPKDDHHTYYKFVVGKAKMGKPLSQKEKSFANSYRLMRQEEVEQIDELKKATLASYIDKAADSVKSKKDAAANMYRFTKQVTSAMKKSAEGDKRIEGIKSATKRLAKEEIEQIDEKNVPTSPEKWAQAKAQAKAKFDVYPSAYANGWAAKKYKAMGGGWKSVSEETNNLPFTPDKPKKQSVVAGKYGKGYSTARHLARSAMQKQVEKMKKQPIKEESRKAAIVKDIMKKKKGTSDDAFQKEPELSSTLTKVQ